MGKEINIIAYASDPGLTCPDDVKITAIKKRLDRYGVEIIPRNVTLKSGTKSEHKLVFVDKVKRQEEA